MEHLGRDEEHTVGHTQTQTDRQTDKQTDRQTHTQTDRQTDTHTHTHTKHAKQSLQLPLLVTPPGFPGFLRATAESLGPHRQTT